jgi:hypothetical protein
MNYGILVVFFLMVTTIPIYAQTTEYSNVEKSTIYKLDFMENTYLIPFSVNAEILAMTIDPESRSLLIGLANTQDSKFTIDLKHELISAQNNDFVVLANGKEIDYQITSTSDSSKFTFFVPEFTEEVEIIGTRVIPEFPGTIILILGIMTFSIVIFAKVKLPFFK